MIYTRNRLLRSTRFESCRGHVVRFAHGNSSNCLRSLALRLCRAYTSIDSEDARRLDRKRSQPQNRQMRPLIAWVARIQSSIDTHSVSVIAAPNVRVPGPNMTVGIPREQP